MQSYENAYISLEAEEPEAVYGNTEPEANDRSQLAERLVRETDVNIFLTGKAGTGKTTFLRRMVETGGKRMIVLAPTGIAAINAGGVTIHSFFQLNFAPFIPGVGFTEAENKRFRFSKEKRRLIRMLDLLVIDEVSMVRPDVLDAVDDVLRRFRDHRKPFGGVQLLLIGDLRQLSPVVQEQEWHMLREHYATPYFFESHALREAGFVTIELTKVYRQQDHNFVEILNKIRDNRADDHVLEYLNRRALPVLGSALSDHDREEIILLTTHNFRADAVNAARLAAIDREKMIYSAEIKGDFPEKSYPAEVNLTLKVGARVMFIKNDSSGSHEYYNGLLGTVSSLSPGKVYVRTHEEMPRELAVTYAEWENSEYHVNENNGQMETDVRGTFSQIPLRLAWAITIHKSQGLTFDRVLIDASRAFAPGQTYVALSRCRSLEGLYLEQPLHRSAIMTDGAVSDFINSHRHTKSDTGILDYFREKFYATVSHRLFDMQPLIESFENYHRAVVSELSVKFPRFCEKCDQLYDELQTKVSPVARTMHEFLDVKLPSRSDDKIAELIRSKMRGGSAYFAEYADKAAMMARSTPKTIDNKAALKRLNNAAESLTEQSTVASELLHHFADNDLTPEEFVRRRGDIYLRLEGKKPSKTSSTSKTSSRMSSRVSSKAKMSVASEQGRSLSKISGMDEDIRNPAVYEKLRSWRNRKAVEENVLPFQICHNSTLMNIAAELPDSMQHLALVKGAGKRFITHYGEDVIQIISECVKH